ncbi:MAG: spore coat associated protein CotJA [Lachnospiraceae bacterium]|nr:spore coat associated protein CotJA [Lachnospiraceae bacterium]
MMNNCNPSRCSKRYPSSGVMCPEASMENFPLAMAYVPIQKFSTVYEVHEALKYGTIFPELNKPFLGSKGGCRC